MYPPGVINYRLPRTNAACGNVRNLILAMSLMLFSSGVGSTGCGGELTGSYGVVVSPGYPQAYPVNQNCQWHIAPNVTGRNSTTVRGLTLTFQKFQVKAGEALIVYTSDPSADPPPEPVTRYRGKVSAETKLSISSSDQVWLKFQSSSTQSHPGPEIPGFLIVYVVRGADVQCKSDPLPNGKISDARNDSFALDSTVEFQCDRGFRMDGSHSGKCTLTMDGPDTVSPQWSNVPKCVSTCPAPAGIHNGSFTKSSNRLGVNSTVTYSCNPPYRLAGPSIITCTLDVTAVPHWNTPAPICSVPNCQNPISFTDFSGTFVNPSYPRRFVTGGTNCQWTIRVEAGKVVNFNISYFDLPASGELTFRDGTTKRLILVLHGGQQSGAQRNFSSPGRSVEVIYNAAPANSSEHDGFYVSYTTVEPSGRPAVSTTTTPSLTVTPAVTTPENTGGPSSVKVPLTEGDSNNHSTGGKIAAGVIVPIVLISLILAVVYRCYRKKYPVRMILGRDFAKFSNPAYSPSQGNQMHTLVREDAEEFFQQTQPTGNVTLILGDDDEEAKVSYVNVAFQYDAHDVDEEEVEKRFRQQKAYLFKKDEDEDEAERRPEADKEDGVKDKQKDRSKVNGQAGRDHGHDNAAFSGESDTDDVDDQDSEKTGVENGKKDLGESERTSSEVSNGSDKENKLSSQQNGLSPDTDIASAPKGVPDGGQNYPPSLTVRDFLLQARDKRAMSDITSRARADSLTINFDSKKSARGRAQSAENIWSSVTPSSSQLLKENLTTFNTSGATPTDVSHTVQSDTNAGHGTYENLNVVAQSEKSAENVPEVTQAVLKPGETDTAAVENNTTNSYENVDGTPVSHNSGNLSAVKEDDSNRDHRRTDSSSSCDSYDEVVTIKSPIHPVSSNASVQSLRGDDSDSSSLKQETETVDGSADSSTFHEHAYANGAGVAQSKYTNTQMESRAQNDNETVDDSFVEDYVNLGGIQITTDADNQPRSPETAESTSVGMTMGHPTERHQSQDHDDQSSVSGTSPSSSLVVQFTDDIEDFDVKDDDYDEDSIKPDKVSDGDRGSSDGEDVDGESFECIGESEQEDEQEGAVHFNLSEQQTSAEAQKKPVSVQLLPGLTYSDHSSSSLSSIASDRRGNDEFVEASQSTEQRPVDFQAASADKSPPSRTAPADHERSASDPASIVLSSSPQTSGGPQGLAVLNLHPSVGSRPSDSDVSVNLTDDDIQRALEECSDDSSDDKQFAVSARQQADSGKVPTKIEPTEMFVFSEEDDNEDIDV